MSELGNHSGLSPESMYEDIVEAQFEGGGISASRLMWNLDHYDTAFPEDVEGVVENIEHPVAQGDDTDNR